MKKLLTFHFFVTKILPFLVLAVAIFTVALVVHLQTQSDAFLRAQANNARITETEESVATTPSPSPTPREVYVPYITDLPAFPEFSTLSPIMGYFQTEVIDTILQIRWEPVEDTDYYHMRVLDANNQFMQEEIWKADVTSWEFADFTGAKIVMLCYQDMGVDGTDDDALLSAYLYEVEIIATPTPTPTPTPKTSGPKPTAGPTAGPTAVPTAVPTPVMNKYLIIVDKADFAFGVFTYDENNEYTKLVATYPCALGRSGKSTPLGTHTIGNKGEWKTWSGYSPARYSPYYTQYYSGLYFHGPVYYSKSGDALDVATYDEIGTAASAGCVRTTTRGARFVYYNCSAGTKVQIVESSTLVSYPGKPAIDPNYPTWDPTDPNKPSAIPDPTITLSCTPGEGTVSGGGSYADGTLITIHATPTDGFFVFAGWVDGAGNTYPQQSYTFYVTASATYTAIFQAIATPTPTPMETEPTLTSTIEPTPETTPESTPTPTAVPS